MANLTRELIHNYTVIRLVRSGLGHHSNKLLAKICEISIRKKTT